MRFIAALAAAVLAGAGFAQPAFAADTFVFDNAHLLSASAVSNLNAKIGDFQTQTGKEVVVDTEPSLGGQSAQSVAEHDFAQHQVNGTMIFVAKAEKQIGVIPDRTSNRFFPSGATTAIRNAMRAGFNSGDFDGGITNGVDLTLAQYRSHEGALHRTSYAPTATRSNASTGGFSMIWTILLIVAAFLIVRAIIRAISRPRMYPPGGPGYGQGPGPGPGYGGPGYGGGYGGGGFGGGGGGFFSGLLGGLGGAFLGNELFNRGGMGGFGGGDIGQAGMIDPGQSQDAGGWQSDPGQADMGNASFGGFGDSGGGGFDGGGGGSDFGGGGDSGGW